MEITLDHDHEENKYRLKAGHIIIAVVDMETKEVKVSDDWCTCIGLTLLVGREFVDSMLPFRKKITCNQCGIPIESTLEETMTSTFKERRFDGKEDTKEHDQDVVILQRCPKCSAMIGDLGYVADIDSLYKDLKTEMEG